MSGPQQQATTPKKKAPVLSHRASVMGSTPGANLVKPDGFGAEVQWRLLQGLPWWDPLDALTTVLNPETEMPDASICLFGQRRTGKSFLGRHIMWLLKDYFPCGIVLTDTGVNGFWQQYLPPPQVIELRFLDRALEEVIKRQEILVKQEKADRLPKGLNPYMFVILDDWISDPKHARYNHNVHKLFVQGRHLHIFVIAMTQYAKAVSTYIRGNIDYAIVFRQTMQNQREAVYEDHMALSGTDKNLIGNMLDIYTQDNEVIVVNKTPGWKSIDEVFYHWKADEVTEEKFLCPELWKKYERDKKLMEQLEDRKEYKSIEESMQNILDLGKNAERFAALTSYGT